MTAAAGRLAAAAVGALLLWSPVAAAQEAGRPEPPASVEEDYPEDRAHGFEVGDLRGVYSVFVAEDDAPEGEPGEGRSR